MLIPLTESLYVTGTLDTVDTVLLEIGTGYYIEVRACAGSSEAATAVWMCECRVGEAMRACSAGRWMNDRKGAGVGGPALCLSSVSSHLLPLLELGLLPLVVFPVVVLTTSASPPFHQRTTAEGIDFCKRKVLLVRDQTDQLSKVRLRGQQRRGRGVHRSRTLGKRHFDPHRGKMRI